MVPVTIRYWAGAAAAAGMDQETIQASSVAEALDQVGNRRGPDLQRVIGISSILVAGRRISPEERTAPLHEAVLVEVLPPFAGG
ncbi:MAG TPA: MoaD/ThiS family protein [Propionibacterium sp.]|jgi:molybdopterin converting factor small subunit|nr:MoaD/ThiS family protein [Propionibacterium sp.]